ncbi:MAG: chloride channel protein [Gemmatimonadota bacterium]
MHLPTLRRLRLAFRQSTTVGPVSLAVLVGLLAAVGAIVLRWLIAWVKWVSFEVGLDMGSVLGVPVPGWVVTLVVPAVGMVIVSAMVRAWAPEAMGHGVPEVQFAIQQRGGRIRPRVAVVKAIASALSIGTGGSVGREGPIVQIGSGLGSTVAQIVGLGPEDVKILVAAGSAGAIGATFNAPIAGVIFALEIILGSFAARSFGLVVISAVTATAAARAALGAEPAFRLVEQFTLVSHWEFGFYLLLGLLAGGVGLLFIQAVYGMEEWFERWRVSPSAKAVAGGLAVGALGTFGSVHLFGVGHEGVELALAGELTTGLMIALIFLKMMATSVTLAAGGSGGVFAPALFVGAMTGGVVGRIANLVAPTLVASPGAYALVGAAAVFGAAAHAPMTGIIILFEMTDNYRIILPLMLSVVLAQLIASRLFPDSIYSIKLRRLGGMKAPHTQMGTLDIILVADAMIDEVPAVDPDLPLEDLADRARDEETRSWVVLDEDGGALGVVTLTDLERAMLEDGLFGRTVRDIMTTALVTTRPDETLREAFRRFGEHDVHLMPVVNPETGEVVGILRRTEMMWAFKELSDEHQRLMSRRAGVPYIAEGSGPVHVEIQVSPDDHEICFKQVRDIPIPPHILIALLRRGDRTVVPRGFTRVEPGDILTLITAREYRRELETWVAQHTSSVTPVRAGGEPI